MEQTSGGATWRRVVSRVTAAVVARGSGRRHSGWSIGVPIIAVVAGLLFTTTATTANGTVLREDRRPELTELIQARRARIAASEQRAARLRDDVAAQTDALAGSDKSVAAQTARADAIRRQAGLIELTGPGVTVELDDAPQLGDNRPASATNNDLVVHQSDVQAVVNALWAGGAEAMSIMNVRVLSTSAVRCVGNTLLLHGRVYSPPFKITAIGDPAALQRSLAASEGVRLFKEDAEHFQLGYRETVESSVTIPAYDGSSALRFAKVPR
ncbi:MAG TPA: DUF881 domain-containing protein [Micromonosporaceae bacterium]